MNRPNDKLPVYRLTQNVIRAKADQFRLDYWRLDKIPVDIDLAIERYGLDIAPLPGLRALCAQEACVSMDCSTIWVDYTPANNLAQDFRLRFSLAHELGHLLLHREILEWIPQSGVQSVLEWAKRIREVSADLYSSRLEKDADEFAGRLLVPRNDLERETRKVLDATPNQQYLRSFRADPVREHLARKIHRAFQVNVPVIETRLRIEEVYP
ncbi:MAG: ImmA/IrrE family metallo-endopeptidase [Candidatus Sumerlaeota bacterium]|nr:ImmA/IrrE family metallo-endopeptidase [Candidatus Sumerlaeota bacterium]